ncbi:hypothetical protein PFICI_06924 [Pestalotiopsis fici W106-1]|uniref:Uncharacterized protein n=1 Tax=Pestalotiopsis fici (strain W106-1 / CGMCC3.15140) TaxID=1229662 RepID=W3X949_PESFW|nr:uncharacterized protein PFICI_06924 [Pestalotiopsis fici W106-1]ETS81922.1 hypothetical protein PFICI_06924 [Pestalotiopsis fici W106-1]
MGNDEDDKPPQTRGSFATAPRYARISTSRSSRSYGSYETGESSTANGDASAVQDPSLTASALAEHDASSKSRHIAKDGTRRRSHKPRPTGGFLLADPIYDGKLGHSTAVDRDDERRRSRIPIDGRRAKSPMPATVPDELASRRTYSSDYDVDMADMIEGATEERHAGKGLSSATSRIPTARPKQAVDLDSTQIVSMALNLSESRRMAQRRNISSPMPPRLAHVADSPVGGGLKQHLQQQRRTSRNLSPKPEKSGPAPRTVSVSHQRLTNPLQASFDPDSTYTYHFSSSTLNRAQKAKEHFELMAQYRRMLNFVPPLQAKSQASRPSTSSPPTSPNGGQSSASYPFPRTQVPLGRPYNPLQYIRNRKVRARERKVIDGEAQGFSDVNRVTDWVDQAATMAAASPLQPDNAPTIPMYPAAHNIMDPEVLDLAQISSASKSKRPRIDWFFEPADLVADLYWVEQDDNKSLIEDRHYSRIFPYPKKSLSISRPMSPSKNETMTTPFPPTPMSHGEANASEASMDRDHSDSNAVSRADTETSHVSARDRARQKLQELKGLHHWHNSSHNHHDFLHMRKSSFSDTSDSDGDRRKRERSGTVSANSKALLEKQMNEMLAREALAAKQKSTQDTSAAAELRPKPFRTSLMTPEKSPGPSVTDNAGSDARMEGSDIDRSDRAPLRHGSPVRSGRPSLEVPRWTNRASLDFDSSAPTSPDLRATKNGGHHIPAIGMDLSPPGSRPVSPVRKPFSKVKNIFRDRSRDRAAGATSGRDEHPDSPVDESGMLLSSPVSADDLNSTVRLRSKSPAPRIPRVETHKSHKSIGSLRLGKDEQMGLRNILKGGAKIDGIIRGGVSKLSDLVWKKDQESDSSSSSTSSDESEAEPARGRLRTPAALSDSSLRKTDEAHQGRNYLDAMPVFKPTSETDRTTIADSNSKLVPLNNPSQVAGRRSSRFDQLKPPRIDVSNASPTSSTGPLPDFSDKNATISDSDSRWRDSGVLVDESHMSGLDALLSLPAPLNRPQRSSSSQTRHWSISDRSPSPQPSTQLSKREVARLRALALSSGIKAMEIARRAAEPQPIISPSGSKTILPVPWDELRPLVADKKMPATVSQLEVYTTTAQVLASSIRYTDTALEKSAAAFANGEMRQVHGRVDTMHTRVATDLIDMTRRAADEADECSRDMVDSQRLKVKRVVDIIDKMLRRRRRRFRWVRRGGWLMVEWVLVGFMWYVWFVVMILRIFLGIGRGVWAGAKWLLWL